MSVYTPLKIGYVHIPRTAGTSISSWLMSNISGSLKPKNHESHESASLLLKEYPEINYFFTIVRNPWSRAVSMYRFHTTKVPKEINLDFFSNDMKAFDEFKQKMKSISFEEYVTEYINFPSNTWYDSTTTQTKWLDLPTELIVKYENLNTEFEKIQKLFRNNSPLLHLNKHNHSNENHYISFYNEYTKKRIAEIYAEDIETFKYKFEE